MRWDERERGQWDEGNGFNKPHDSPTHFSTSFPQFHFTPLHSIWIIRKTKISNSWKKIYWAFRYFISNSIPQKLFDELTEWTLMGFPFSLQIPKVVFEITHIWLWGFCGFLTNNEGLLNMLLSFSWKISKVDMTMLPVCSATTSCSSNLQVISLCKILV